MKKLIFHKIYGEGNPNNSHNLFGISQEIKWKLTSYFGGPKEEGTYLTADGKGNIRSLCCTGDHKGRSLVEAIMDYHLGDYVWSDTRNRLTSDEILELWNAYMVWYEYEKYLEYDSMESRLIIYRGEDIPKYFLENELNGPLDSDLENLDEELYYFGDITNM